MLKHIGSCWQTLILNAIYQCQFLIKGLQLLTPTLQITDRSPSNYCFVIQSKLSLVLVTLPTPAIVVYQCHPRQNGVKIDKRCMSSMWGSSSCGWRRDIEKSRASWRCALLSAVRRQRLRWWWWWWGGRGSPICHIVCCKSRGIAFRLQHWSTSFIYYLCANSSILKPDPTAVYWALVL